MFADVGTNGAPINGLVGVPVRTMPYAFTAPAAVRFTAVADLLVISNLAASHLASIL